MNNAYLQQIYNQTYQETMVKLAADAGKPDELHQQLDKQALDPMMDFTRLPAYIGGAGTGAVAGSTVGMLIGYLSSDDTPGAVKRNILKGLLLGGGLGAGLGAAGTYALRSNFADNIHKTADLERSNLQELSKQVDQAMAESRRP